MSNSASKQYKMVFCDIDGTLIDSSGRISNNTKQTIQELYGKGVPFILVSARMPSGIWPIQNELGIKASIVCYSGALILDEHGACAKSIGIEREKAVIINDFVKREFSKISCGSFFCDSWLVDDINDKWVRREWEITSSIPTEGKIIDAIPPDGCLHKFLCMGEAEHISSLEKALRERYPELSVCLSKDTYLEIMDGLVSKSAAVKYLCERYGISISDTVSFGDNYNDVDMLLATGIGFAMGNAPEEVKRRVPNITPENDREGVLFGLKQLDFAGN